MERREGRGPPHTAKRRGRRTETRLWWVFIWLAVFIPTGMTIRLSPEERKLGEVLTHWQLPEGRAAGVLLVFHGCNHDGADWFELPEDSVITHKALAHSLAVVAFSSLTRYGYRCWSTTWPPSSNNDALAVTLALAEWYQVTGISSDLPLFGIGVSSGGMFVSIITHTVEMTAICIQIAPGSEEALFTFNVALLPAIVYLHMPRDTVVASVIAFYAKQLRAEGADILELTAAPKPLTKTYMAEHIPAISETNSAHLFDRLQKKHYLTEDHYLSDDPRTGFMMESLRQADVPSLRSVVASHTAAIEQELNVLYARHEITSEHCTEVLRFFNLKAAAKRRKAAYV